MSNSREQSYYEIALTNRQVMSVFVVLLICVVAAFLGGVWVGRGSQVTVSTAEPEEIASGVEPGEPPLQEIEFFSQPARQAAAPPQRQDAGRQAAVPQAREEQRPAIGEPQQAVILEEVGSAAAAQPPAATPAITEESQPAQAPATSPATPAGAEALVVQVFSSNDQAQAQRILERVRGGGYPAVMSTGDVSGKPTYRVRVGPYASREQAQEVADKIRRAYKLDTWITQ